MEHEEYELMYRAEDHHWWYRGMRAITTALLDRHVERGRELSILDGGCGTGSSMQYLAAFGRVTGVDLAPEALHFCRERGLERLARASILELPFAAAAFDLVTSFDVMSSCGLEHEAEALGEFARVLRPGGHLLLRLPAYGWLHGLHDRKVHTRHRYTRREIKQRLREHGFVVQHTSYANSLLFPLVAAKRLFDRVIPSRQRGSDVTLNTAWSNAVFSALLRAEAPLVSRIGLPFGLTVVALAKKPVG